MRSDYLGTLYKHAYLRTNAPVGMLKELKYVHECAAKREIILVAQFTLSVLGDSVPYACCHMP